MEQMSSLVRSQQQQNSKEVNDYSGHHQYLSASAHSPPGSGGGLMPPPTGVPGHLLQSQHQMQSHQQNQYIGSGNQFANNTNNSLTAAGIQQMMLQQSHHHLQHPHHMTSQAPMHSMMQQGFDDMLTHQLPSHHTALTHAASRISASPMPPPPNPDHISSHLPSHQQHSHTSPTAPQPSPPQSHLKSMAPPAKRGRRGRPPGSTNHSSRGGTASSRGGHQHHHTSPGGLNQHSSTLLNNSGLGGQGAGDEDGFGGLEDEDHENTLFGAIRSGRVAPQTLVDDWIEQYKTNRDPAMLELMQFFISCSGCKGKITPEMYSRITHADIIRRMTEEFDEDSGEYPLIQIGKNWRRFRSGFVDFIQILIRQCQYSIIYDQYMIDQVIGLLTGLTDSQVRAFRHTSTLAAMKMMTGLVDVALNLSINRDNTQRQYESERSKGQAKRASDRLDLLMNRRQELEENMEEVKNMLIFLFKGVFVHRYRDTLPEIRSICMQEIGVWMRRYPQMFLDDSYLKYVGWTLFDRVSEVRLQCTKALQTLYEDITLADNLALFTSRFKARLVDMTLDKEPEVAVQAVKVISCILSRHNENILEDKDCENIYELVYCSHRPLAQAAGEFLSLKLFQLDPHAPETKTKKGKKRSENTPLVRDLIQFFIESELHEHAAYLVDSLWESSSMLRDWECMLDLLLEEPGRGEEVLDPNQEDSLIEILTCCVKQAATGESPVGRQPGGARAKQPTQRETRQMQEEKSRLTEAFIPALPQLLLKYAVDAVKMVNLLQVPIYMDLEMYTSGRQERALDLLLKYLHEAVAKHTDADVLLNCSKVYEALCAEEVSISIKCQTVRGTLLDQLNESYRQAFGICFDGMDNHHSDEEFALIAALKRVYAFYSYHDMTALDLWDSLMTICQSALERSRYNEEMVTLAIGCSYQAILWQFNRIDEESPDRDDVKDIRSQLTTFITIASQLLNSEYKRVSREAFISVCDLLVVFARHYTEEVPSLFSLKWEADRELENALASFLQRRVFVEDEVEIDENVKIEDLHDRRTHLACFCKLIVYNMLPIRCASVVYKNYLRFYNDFGDIMKSTLGKAREINRVQTAKMIARSLIEGYMDLEVEQEGCVNRNSDGFQALKELARRHNLSFGLDLVKIRESMVSLQTVGIQTCLQAMTSTAPGAEPPSNLALLELVAEFANKLLKQDKHSLLQYVNRVFPSPIGEAWCSLNVYRTALDPDLVETSSVSGSMAGHPSNASIAGPHQHHTGTGNPRGRPKRQNRDSELPGGVPVNNVPQATSTVVKRRRINSSHLPSPTSTPIPPALPPGVSTYQDMPLSMFETNADDLLQIQPKYSSRGRPIRAPNREGDPSAASNLLNPTHQVTSR